MAVHSLARHAFAEGTTTVPAPPTHLKAASAPGLRSNPQPSENLQVLTHTPVDQGPGIQHSFLHMASVYRVRLRRPKSLSPPLARYLKVATIAANTDNPASACEASQHHLNQHSNLSMARSSKVAIIAANTEHPASACEASYSATPPHPTLLTLHRQSAPSTSLFNISVAALMQLTRALSRQRQRALRYGAFRRVSQNLTGQPFHIRMAKPGHCLRQPKCRGSRPQSLVWTLDRITIIAWTDNHATPCKAPTSSKLPFRPVGQLCLAIAKSTHRLRPSRCQSQSLGRTLALSTDAATIKTILKLHPMTSNFPDSNPPRPTVFPRRSQNWADDITVQSPGHRY